MSAVFKSNLKTLILKKSVEVGEAISQTEIQEQTGLSQPTVSRWLSGDVTRIEADTLDRFMKYLGCQMTELITLQSGDTGNAQ